MCHKLDPVFFTRLAGMNPEDVCRRSRAVYDAVRLVYRITALGHDYEVDPKQCIIFPCGTNSQGTVSQAIHEVLPDSLKDRSETPHHPASHPYASDARIADENKSTGISGANPVSVELGLLILMYLLEAKIIPPAGKWVNEYSLKGGAMFFRGPHAFRTYEIAKRFGRDVEGFKKACIRLGGEPEQMGDAAFRFQILPRIQAVVVLWYADDEFDASVKLLMDPTIEEHLPLDEIFGMGLELLGRILGKNLWG